MKTSVGDVGKRVERNAVNLQRAEGEWSRWPKPEHEVMQGSAQMRIAEPTTLPGIEAPPPDVETPAPETETPPAHETEHRPHLLPPWKVLLHNDDHNDMVYVVQSLLKAVAKLGRRRAVEIMLEAHRKGVALVITCPLELAELYRDRLQSFGLTATIERG